MSSWTGSMEAAGLDDVKLLAKCAVARLCAGLDLGRFKKLQELDRRLRRERDDPYDWLRLGLQKPGALSRDEYTRLACRLYRTLVDTHLRSGKPSRAAPPAHYSAVVAELSGLVGDPAVWTDLLRHLRRAYANTPCASFLCGPCWRSVADGLKAGFGRPCAASA